VQQQKNSKILKFWVHLPDCLTVSPLQSLQSPLTSFNSHFKSFWRILICCEENICARKLSMSLTTFDGFLFLFTLFYFVLLWKHKRQRCEVEYQVNHDLRDFKTKDKTRKKAKYFDEKTEMKRKLWIVKERNVFITIIMSQFSVGNHTRNSKTKEDKVSLRWSRAIKSRVRS
jgi:hypothetical protein